MKERTNSQVKSLTHIYMRDAEKGFLRPCWAEGREIYCGVCMKGVVQAVTGASCPNCKSKVEQILDAVAGVDSSDGKRRRKESA
jgi:hypothetical protein